MAYIVQVYAKVLWAKPAWIEKERFANVRDAYALRDELAAERGYANVRIVWAQ